MIADLFSDKPELSTAAFSAISFSNGLAGSIGYFSFPYSSRITMASIVTFSALIAILCYWIVAYLHYQHLDFVSSSARFARYKI